MRRWGLGNGRDLRRWEGIETATGLVDFLPEMKDSVEHPRAKLDKISHQLDFMGNGGSKWSKEKEQMERMLQRVGERGGQVRMLLLRPDCEVCKEASRNRPSEDEHELPQRITCSLEKLEDLRQRFPHLQIKLYDHAPFFRLVFVDKKMVVVGHYQKYWQDSVQTPLLVLEDKQGENDWSFYVAFNRYFEEEWDKGSWLTSKELDRFIEEFGT